VLHMAPETADFTFAAHTTGGKLPQASLSV